MLFDFTRQGRASGWERVNEKLNWDTEIDNIREKVSKTIGMTKKGVKVLKKYRLSKKKNTYNIDIFRIWKLTKF